MKLKRGSMTPLYAIYLLFIALAIIFGLLFYIALQQLQENPSSIYPATTTTTATITITTTTLPAT